MQLVAKAFHGSANMLKLRELAKPAIPATIKKLVLVLPCTILRGIVQVNPKGSSIYYIGSRH